jgi:hypothetical protein
MFLAGTWEPDDDSVQDSLDVVEEIQTRLARSVVATHETCEGGTAVAPWRLGGGIPCVAPDCECTILEGGAAIVAEGVGYQDVTCTECRSYWVERYALVGYTDFQLGDVE